MMISTWRDISDNASWGSLGLLVFARDAEYFVYPFWTVLSAVEGNRIRFSDCKIKKFIKLPSSILGTAMETG